MYRRGKVFGESGGTRKESMKEEKKKPGAVSLQSFHVDESRVSGGQSCNLSGWEVVQHVWYISQCRTLIPCPRT